MLGVCPPSFLLSLSTAGPASVCTEPDSVPRPQGGSALGIKQMERQLSPQEPALMEGTCPRTQQPHLGERGKNTGWAGTWVCGAQGQDSPGCTKGGSRLPGWSLESGDTGEKIPGR